MNNVVAILIDSVIWECVGTSRLKVSPTPFLDSLKNESFTASKLYSHGPYTDAATKSLYTGRNCLDDFGYYFRLNTSPSNHFQAFHEAGYETYGVYYPYYTVGNTIRESIDHIYYSAGFIFKSEWGGIFSYYSRLIKKRELIPQEWGILIKRTELMFETWKSFYNDALNSPDSISFIREAFSSFNVSEKLALLQNEERAFQDNPRGYILNLLNTGLNHRLATIDNIDWDNEIDRRKLLEVVYKPYAKLFSSFSKSNFKANVLKNCPSLRRFLWGGWKFLKTRDFDHIKFLANYFVCLRDVKKSKEKSLGHWQDLPSARKHMQFATTLIDNHKSNRPFYLSLHILDPHNYVSFFSYDMLEEAIISEEMEILREFAEKMGTDFVGSLAYYLSLRYVDFCIEKFCAYLKEKQLWDNTTLLFMADHGSSYSFFPLHGARVNCFDDECYHVPMIIRSPEFNGYEFNHYANSKDVFPTLFDMVGIKKPCSFVGNSMLDKSFPRNSFVITEYMGPGCPDMLSRPIWFSIRDCHYIIGYKVGVYESFEDGELSEVYDLTNDKNGYYNISDKICKSQIDYLLVHLKNRFEQIKHDTINLINEYRNESTNS